MTGFLYVLGTFLRANLRQGGTLFVWALTVALALASSASLLFLPLDGASAAVASQYLFVLTLDPLLSEREVNQLAWEIASWPEAKRVNFRFAGEEDPEPLEERALVVEATPEGREALAARLAKLTGIQKVTALERKAVRPGLPSLARVGSLAGLILSLGLALFLGYRAMGRAEILWEEEKQILKLSGLGSVYLRGPFWALGAFVGFLGAAAFVLVLWLGLRFVPQDPRWADVLKNRHWLTGVSIPLGTALGFLSALLRPHS